MGTAAESEVEGSGDSSGAPSAGAAAGEHARAAHTRRRRRSAAVRSDARGRWLLVAAVLVAALGLGGVHWAGLVCYASIAFAASVHASSGVRGSAKLLPVLLPLGLGIFTLLQVVPIPMRMLQVLSPATADVWARAVLPFGEPQKTWGIISADPGATLLEALKWTSYAAVLSTAIVFGARRGGARSGASLLFFAAVVVGVVTFVHGVLGLGRVYGFYTPTFVPSRFRVGPLLNPNNLAGYLNLGLLSGLGLFVSRRPPLPRVAIGIGVASLMALVFVCASRGGLIALLAGLLLFAISARRERGPDASRAGVRLVLPLMAVIGGALVFAWLGASPETRRELLDKNVEKLEVMRHVAPLVRDHPVFGVGRGAFETVFPAYHIGSTNVLYGSPENFALQWIAEWGLPVGIGALLAFAWLFASSRRAARATSAGAGLWAGLGALVLQNLLDLAFEVPGVAVAAFVAIGVLWAASSDGEERADSSEAFEPASPRALAVGAAVLGGCLAVLVPFFSRNDPTKDRTLVKNLFHAADFRDASSTSSLNATLREALLRHPADPYFPRIGALVAWHTGKNPLPWFDRALDRGMESGATHFALARVLAGAGAKSQALLETRFAITHQPGLASQAGRLIVAITQDFDEILEAVPDGPAGEQVLYFVGLNAGRGKNYALRIECFDAAIERAPGSPVVRGALVGDLVAALGAGEASPLCGRDRRATCEMVAEQQVAEIEKVAPDGPTALVLKAQLWSVTGRAQEAEALLRVECRRFTYDALVRCEKQRVVAAAATGSKELVDAASRELAGAGCGFGTGCGDLYGFLGAQAEVVGDLGRALSYHQRAVADEPTAARWKAVGRVASALGERVLAARAYAQASQKNPADAEARSTAERLARESMFSR